MGALTSNRKRGDECLSFNCAHPSPNLPNFQSSKRPRLSHVNQSPNQLIVSSKSAGSRLSRYPDIKPPLPRVHAPCRTQKFGSFRGVPEERSMGNVLSYHLDKAKNVTFGAFRYSSKDKEVIELDKEVEDDRVSEDSSIEEVVAIVEDDQEGPSVVDYGQELDTKMVDCGTQATHPLASSVVSDLTTTTNTAFKEDSAGKMLDSLSLNREAGVPSKAAYKLLIESVERRTPKLKHLDVQIDFLWKKRYMLESLRPQKKPVEVNVLSFCINFLPVINYKV